MGTLLAVLLAAAGGEEKPTIVALPELRTINLDQKLESFYAEHLALQLKLQGLQVVTQRELQTILGLERQRQLLGCSDETNTCMTELANAMGADAAIVGDIARIGNTFQINLKVIAGRDGRTLAAFSQAAQTEDALLEVLTRAAKELAEPTFRNLGRSPPANLSVVARGTNLRRIAWAPLVGGVALAGAGAACLVLANGSYSTLRSGKPLSLADGQAVASQGRTYELLGFVGLGVGGAALVASGAMLLFGKSSPITPSVAPAPGGAALVLSGAFR